MNVSVVYWIRLLDHVDYKTEGYIGVTSNLNIRLHKHKTSTTKLGTHLSRSIHKYGWDNLVVEILYIGSTKICFKKEKTLRPKFQIGWNEAIGGLGGDRSKYIDYTKRKNTGWNYNLTGKNNPFYGKKHSVKSIDKIIENKSTVKVITPKGEFYGFNAVARFYNINKITAKKWAMKKEGWSYANK